MLKLLRRLIGENIELEWSPSLDMPTVRMDPDQVDQILVNLVVNARDAIEGAGSIAIHTHVRLLDEAFCALHEGSRPGPHAVLEVRDSGSGMDEATLARIFEPFFTTKDLGHGTGLGLATVYGIVKQNEGYIQVDSEVGHGTVFTLMLPFVEPEESPSTEPQVEAQVCGGSETVLLVEDDPVLLKFLERLLAKLGYRVLAADSPLRAIDLARTHLDELDLLVADMVMPGMSGVHLHATLAALKPRLHGVIISGHAGDALDPRQLHEAGLHYLAKPFTMGDLAARLRQALDPGLAPE